MSFINQEVRQKLHLPFHIFTLGYITLMFLPKVVRQGMFPDGLTYAAIARNMAIGKGSFWEPYFSSSFWLPFNTGTVFYEHPPLMMGIQSLFFAALGEHWLVEKIYCAILLLLTLFLISKIWRLVAAPDPEALAFGWLPWLLFYTMPTIIWSYPNNMLDCTMSGFCLAAIYFSTKALLTHTGSYLFLFLSSLFILGAFLTKGPIGFFPLATPIIYYLVFRKPGFSKVMLFQGFLFFSFGLLFLLLLQYAPANKFIQHYFNQQVVNALTGRREDAALSWISHFRILAKLGYQLMPPLILFVLAGLVFRLKKIKIIFNSFCAKWFLYFLLIGLSASVPIAISPKQSSFYLIPSLPYFGLSLAMLAVPTLSHLFEKYKLRVAVSRTVNRVLILSVLAVFVYSLAITGKIRREKEVIQDLEEIAKIVPANTKIGVTEARIKDFTTQTYFQRFHQLELANDTTLNFFLVDSLQGDALFRHPGFTRIKINTSRYILYQKQNMGEHAPH